MKTFVLLKYVSGNYYIAEIVDKKYIYRELLIIKNPHAGLIYSGQVFPIDKSKGVSIFQGEANSIREFKMREEVLLEIL